MLDTVAAAVVEAIAVKWCFAAMEASEPVVQMDWAGYLVPY